MTYADGKSILAGDKVTIAGRYHGVVLASMDEASYLPGEEGWAYLGTGVMIDTDFGGLVHYQDDAQEDIRLESRAGE